MSDPAPQTEPKNDDMVLSSADVQRLLTDRTPEVRLSMSSKVAGAYQGASFNGAQAGVAEQIFRLLMRDTEVKVRAALADQLKQSTHIPRDIVMTMAKDVEEVSLPVLRYSEVLTDKDLVQLIASSNDTAKHMAITQRDKLSGDVAGALVQTGNSQVVGSLMENKGAEIHDQMLHKIVQDFSGEQGVMAAMAGRAQLPPDVAEKLVAHVSGSLAEALKNKYKKSGSEIAEQAAKTRETATTGLLRASMSDEEMDVLARSLMANHRLTPSLILSTLCQGHWRFFNLALAKLAGIPLENANTLLADHGGMGFRALYKKSGLSEPMFDSVKLLYRIVRELHEEGMTPAKKEYPARLAERLLGAAEGEDMEILSQLVALVRKGG